jgi:putative nucleotidyltransferase with HDIG domain
MMSESDLRSERREGRIEFLTESGYWDQSSGVRLIIAIAFAVMFFSVIHFRDVRIENFELDTEAKSYAVAQVDFDFHDKEATLISQQEALRDLGWLYIITDKHIEQIRRDFKRHLREHDDWRAHLQDASFDQMYSAVSALFDTSRQIIFTDGKTYNKLQKLGLNVDRVFVLDGVSDQESLRIPRRISHEIARIAFKESHDLPEQVEEFAIEYLEDEIWQFEVDVTSQHQVRDQIFNQIPQKNIRVKAGTRIIDQGERVRERHLEMLKAMKEALKEKMQITKPLPILSSLMLSLVFVFFCASFLRVYYPENYYSNRRLFLLFVAQMVTFLLAEVTERVILDSMVLGLDIIDSSLFLPLHGLILLPFFPTSVVIFSSFLVLTTLSVSLPVEGPAFLFTNAMGLLAAIISRPENHPRSSMIFTCFKIWLAAVFVFLSLNIYTMGKWDSSLLNDIIFMASCVGISGVLVLVFQPVIENAFKIMTEMTLMDYLDPGRELLRRLSIEAPGTYQHSLLVAHLSEVAASAIGARSLFCRVSSFYHDVGKLAFPHYFVENQQGVNVHQLLTPLESAQVIIAHVSEGVMMARKYGLPEPFIDIIKEHHGTSLVYYFWRKAKEQLKEGQQLDEKDFRYCGPKPRSKEAAIILLADCLEAASRSADEVNDEKTTQLMESIVRHEMLDGQLDQCSLTLQELATVKRVLVKTLVAASHSRVKYPKRESDDS